MHTEFEELRVKTEAEQKVSAFDRVDAAIFYFFNIFLDLLYTFFRVSAAAAPRPGGVVGVGESAQ